MRKIFTLVLSALSLTSMAQMTESFTDGDLTADPTWVGNTSHFSIVTTSDVGATSTTNSNTLRLSAPNNQSPTYISTQVPGTWAEAQSWGFWVGRRGTGYDASNFIYIWLYANESNLTSATVDGYRVRVGDNT